MTSEESLNEDDMDVLKGVLEIFEPKQALSTSRLIGFKKNIANSFTSRLSISLRPHSNVP
jgi:hypothetical protein